MKDWEDSGSQEALSREEGDCSEFMTGGGGSLLWLGPQDSAGIGESLCPHPCQPSSMPDLDQGTCWKVLILVREQILMQVLLWVEKLFF